MGWALWEKELLNPSPFLQCAADTAEDNNVYKKWNCMALLFVFGGLFFFSSPPRSFNRLPKKIMETSDHLLQKELMVVLLLASYLIQVREAWTHHRSMTLGHYSVLSTIWKHHSDFLSKLNAGFTSIKSHNFVFCSNSSFIISQFYISQAVQFPQS